MDEQNIVSKVRISCGSHMQIKMCSDDLSHLVGQKFKFMNYIWYKSIIDVLHSMAGGTKGTLKPQKVCSSFPIY